MFAAIEFKLLILIVFVIISALSSWLKKKQGGEQEEGEPTSPTRRPRSASAPPPPAPPAGKPVSWEEELRRLLQGEIPGTQPAPPPPIVIQQPRHPAPPPIAESAPPPLRHVHKSVFDVIEERSPMDVDVQPSFHALPALTESVQAYQQASHLDQEVERHLREVTQRPIGLTTVHRKGVTPEASAALALVRNPKSMRTAILASIIIGPPRALAE